MSIGDHWIVWEHSPFSPLSWCSGEEKFTNPSWIVLQEERGGAGYEARTGCLPWGVYAPMKTSKSVLWLRKHNELLFQISELWQYWHCWAVHKDPVHWGYWMCMHFCTQYTHTHNLWCGSSPFTNTHAHTEKSTHQRSVLPSKGVWFPLIVMLCVQIFS